MLKANTKNMMPLDKINLPLHTFLELLCLLQLLNDKALKC